jgi:hypothetical protein
MKLKYNIIEKNKFEEKKKKKEYLQESLIDKHEQELVDYATNADQCRTIRK